MPALRDYQIDAISRVREEYKRGAKGVLLVLPTGAGKTVVLSSVANGVIAKGGQVVVFCHRQELIGQTQDKLAAEGLTVGGLYGVTVESVQTMVLREKPPAATFAIFDECFVAGTLVDGAPIEHIKEGSLVASFSHSKGTVELRRVAKVMRSTPKSIVCVRFKNGSKLHCTGSHPFFVESQGYVEAVHLKEWDMCRMRSNLRVPMLKGTQDMLHGVSLEQVQNNNGKNQQEACQFEDESKQPHEESGSSREGFSFTERDRAQAEDSRGERNWSNKGSGDTTSSAGGAVGPGVSSEDRSEAGERIPWGLQVGFGSCRSNGGNRGGRELACTNGKTGSGCEEGEVLERAWVDSVEVLEQGGDGEYGGVCPGGVVYNLEVEGNHNYFAEGVLVHNCHHFGAALWGNLPKAYENAFRLGLTATPERGDGAPIQGFERMVVGITPAELTRLGHLVPCDVFAPAQGTEFADPIAALQEYAPGRQTIIFGQSVAHAQDLADRLGSEAVCIHDKMHWKKREDALKAFKHGEVRVLTNKFLLTEGFDAPTAEVCVLARRVNHAGMFLQSIGRVLRPSPETGKTRAILLDCYGSVYEHGLPTDERQWSLDGKAHALRKGLPSLRQCPKCGSVDRSSPVCRRCGYEFPKPQLPPAKRVEFKKVEAVQLNDDRKRNHFASLRAIAKGKGYAPGWAAVQFKIRWGVYPPREWIHGSSKSIETTGAEVQGANASAGDATLAPTG